MNSEIWTEKYRPEELDDIVNHEKIVSRLKAFVNDNSIPHLLFTGPAGTGKSASALAISKELFGEKWKGNTLELNASDTRGIDVIRNQVKDFARSKSVGDVPFKIIILDEADALTPEAQQALRRTMENYTDTARFVMICNYSSKIIDPIRSRCSIFRFPRLSKDDAKNLLRRICEEEGLDYVEEGLDAIFSVTRGDLRKSINLLQSVGVLDKEVTEEMVYEVSVEAKPQVIGKMLEKVIDGDFMDARDQLQTLLLEKGISGLTIIKEIHRQVYELDIPEKKKVELVEKIGEYEFRIDEGADEQIQLEALLAQFL